MTWGAPAFHRRHRALWLLAALAQPAMAGERVTVSAPAEAVVVRQLSFIKVDDLAFGRIIPGTAAGTVVLAPDGTRTATGGARLATGGLVQPAAFAGKGDYNEIVTIAMTASSATLTRVGGGGTMTIDTFIIGSTPTAQLTTAPLAFRIANTNGMFQFPLGATLRVKANQAAGTYTGTFAVTLDYQ